MSIVNRRGFLEAGIALSAAATWAETSRLQACFPSFASRASFADWVASDGKGSIVPFRIAVPQSKLDRIASRVRQTEFPRGVGNPDSWQYGMSFSAMREVVDYWISKFDWRKAESALNRYPQFLTEVGDFNIHFYHVIGTGPNPFPIILTHGWPGSVFEFLGTIDRLTSDGFSLIIPSLPGFGFSSKPAKGPVGPVTTARLWHTLMTERLGYKRYGVQGGDLGCIVSTQLAYLFPDDVAGLHLNMVPPPQKPEDQQSEEERAWYKNAQEFRAKELDYFQEQAHKPSTVGFTLNDNPVGTAAWMLEKFKIWSDSGATFAPAFTLDQLLTNLTIYLATDTIASSVWFYRGLLDETQGKSFPGHIDVPTAVADYPKDLLNGRPPKSLIAFGYNLVRYTRMPRGGHFAALEQPDLFCEDVADFFHALPESRF
jgi:microsomal epoxide hydrolase